MLSSPRRCAGRCLAAIALALVAAGCERQATPSGSAAAPPEIIKTPTGIEMVVIPAGSFAMGSDRGDSEEAPRHEVSVDAFLMDRFEVTQEEYEKYVIGNPSKFKDPRHPVERVRWVEAALYCNARSAAEKLEPCYDEESFACKFSASGYRLPTEAEWEYACRAGTDGDYSFGEAGKLGEHAWFADNSGDRTHPVGTKRPNAWGLYDMHGNVGEWCQDIHDGKYYQASPAKNPCSLSGGGKRILRGGAYSSAAARCRSSSRSGEAPGSFADACFTRPDIGFRCVRRAEPAAAPAKIASSSRPAR
jgi:formylglycine-generating enzyme required for sulfatase activity